MRLLVFGVVLASASIADAQSDAKLPKVVLVGDSIRLSYAATVAKTLEGKAVIVSSKANGGDSSNVLKNFDAWVIRERPQVVHFNCGIHDTKRFKAAGKFQVSPQQYESNLRAIVEQYNSIADRVMRKLRVPVNDLHALIEDSNQSVESLIGGDGVYLTASGQHLQPRVCAGNSFRPQDSTLLGWRLN